jgi:hypothetical protein
MVSLQDMQVNTENVVKLAIILVTHRVYTTFAEGSTLSFDNDWLTFSGITVAGYFVSKLVLKDLLTSVPTEHKAALSDVAQLAVGIAAAHLVVDGTITKEHATAMLPVVVAVLVYHYLLRSAICASP